MASDERRPTWELDAGDRIGCHRSEGTEGAWRIFEARTGPMTSPWTAVKTWASTLKRDVVALWIAARDPRTPWYAKIAAGLIAAYALSPIDLIPDVVPVLGYLDDLLIVPLGIRIVIAMLPPALMAEFRRKAAERNGKPTSYAGAIGIGALWIAVIVIVALRFWPG